MRKALLIYTLVLTVIGLAVYGTLQYGRGFSPPRPESSSLQDDRAGPGPEIGGVAPVRPLSAWPRFIEHLREPLPRLLLQLVVIVLATGALRLLFQRLRQPGVIGEMAAGILLGPSFLGWLWPQAQHFVFPAESLEPLKLLSQIGACLYLFVVGMELEVGRLRHRAHTAVVVSHSSILLPYLLGVLASLYLYPYYAPPNASFVPFALFMGIAMSITAFPVLARILEERGLSQTELGSIAITCAAVDDVTAWSLLAAIVAIVHAGGFSSVVLSLGLTLVFVALMLGIIRKLLPGWLGLHRLQGEPPGRIVVAGVLLLILCSSLTTELIGIHALFGAFLAGVVMPAHLGFRHHVAVRVEQFSGVFLLPLFFAFTGLRTQVGLLDDARSWIVCLGLVAIATAGKLGGSMFAARLTGMDWRSSFSLGALMNSRGLMELIALNLGYDFGILSPRIFAMMVLMALVTTIMTGPLLSLAEKGKVRQANRLTPGSALMWR